MILEVILWGEIRCWSLLGLRGERNRGIWLLCRGFKMFWGGCQAKVVDCEKFIKGQKVISLTRITGNMLLNSWRNSWSHQLILKSLYLNQRSQDYCLCKICRQSDKEITRYYIILLWCTLKTCLHFSQTQFCKTILRLNRFLIFNAGLVALL